MTNLSVSPREWVERRVWQLRELVAGEWGEDAARIMSAAVSDYVSGEADAERMRRQIRELQDRLSDLQPQAPTPVDPGPTWTGD